MSTRPEMGGADPFKQIDGLLARFREQQKELKATVKERYGWRAGPVYIRGSWWCCRYRKRLHRGMTPEALLERLAETAAGAARPTEQAALGAP